MDDNELVVQGLSTYFSEIFERYKDSLKLRMAEDDVILLNVSPAAGSIGELIKVTIAVAGTATEDNILYVIEFRPAFAPDLGYLCPVQKHTHCPESFGRQVIELEAHVADIPGLDQPTLGEIVVVPVKTLSASIPIFDPSGRYIVGYETKTESFRLKESNHLPFQWNAPRGYTIAYFTANGITNLTLTDPATVVVKWGVDHACEVRVQRKFPQDQTFAEIFHSTLGYNTLITGMSTILPQELKQAGEIVYRMHARNANMPGTPSPHDLVIQWDPAQSAIIDYFTAGGQTDLQLPYNQQVSLRWKVEHACKVRVQRVSPTGPEVNYEQCSENGLNATLEGWCSVYGFDNHSTENIEYLLTATNTSGQTTIDKVLIRLRPVVPKLKIIGAEFVQSIQHFSLLMPQDPLQSNTVPLVSEKDLLVRIYVDSGLIDGSRAYPGAAPNCVPNISGRIKITKWGKVFEFDPFTPVYSGKDPTITAMPTSWINRDSLDSSLNFMIYDTYFGAEVFDTAFTFEAEVWVAKDADGHNYEHDHASSRYAKYGPHPVYYKRCRQIPIAIVPIRDARDPNNVIAAPTFSEINSSLTAATDMLPIFSDFGFYTYIRPELTTTHDLITGDVNNHPGWSDLLDDIEELADDYGSNNLYWAGFVPLSPPYCLGGLAYTGKKGWRMDDPLDFSSNYSLVCVPGENHVFAHELGHSFGFDHVNRGSAPEPYDPRLPTGIEDVAVNVGKFEVYPRNTAELMSYETPSWISIAGYLIVYNRFKV